MEIGRRSYRKSNQGKTISHTEYKIDIVFDIVVLDLFISFAFSENKYIRKSHYIQVRNLFDIINMDLYAMDPPKLTRVNILKRALEGRIEKNINNHNVLMYYVVGGIAVPEEYFIENIIDLTSSEIEWIMSTTSETLKCAFIYPYIDPLIDTATRFKNADFKDRYSIANELEAQCSSLKNACRQAQTESLTDMTFSLMPGKFEEVIGEVYKYVTNPFRRLKTGMQGMNLLLNGGFEETRVYLFAGITSVGKSLTLLNIIYQMKKANKGYVCKDPTKRPCIVLLTMENNTKETITRLFDIVCGKGEFQDYTEEQIINILRVEGELTLTDDNPIDIIIKYRPDRSVDTGYLYTLVEDLEDEGYEVISLFLDHIKKIRSIYNISDVRLELGSIVNELKVFAQLKQISVITDTHLNRDAIKVIESNSNRNIDITKLLGKSNISESMLMVDNVDYMFIINRDYDEDGNEYMAVSAGKIRDKQLISYAALPFKPGSKIALYEDINDPVPAYKDNLHDASNAMLKPNTNVRASAYTENTMEAIDNDNIYSRVSMYDARSIGNISLKPKLDLEFLNNPPQEENVFTAAPSYMPMMQQSSVPQQQVRNPVILLNT